MPRNESPPPGAFPALQFTTGAHRLDQLPADTEREVAISGRSNAGKSSALNTIAGQQRLARTSKTPGRTQQLNVFVAPDGRRLIDLPGYGFAKVPERLRQHFERTIADYLASRRSLVGVLVIMDARHPLRPQDCELISWCAGAALPVHALLTKADKLSRGAAAATLQKAAAALRGLYPDASIQLFSSTARTGVDQARSVILQWWHRGGD